VFKFIPAAVYALTAYFFPIEYVEGNGTNYSYGPLVFIGYGAFVVYCLFCFVLVVANYRKLETHKKWALYPMMTMMMIVVMTQAVIPELLMTSAGITFVCLGLFAVFNNPAKEYRDQVYWDAATGIKNKNGYQMQLEQMRKKYERKKFTVGFLVCDMNGLKVINDNYGHIEGDKLLRAAAKTLKTQLEHAYDVYRVGGDEFVAIYMSPNDALVERDIEKVRDMCDAYTDSPILLSIAMGYASGVYSPRYMDIYNKADEAMYVNKTEIKKKHPELCGR
jgi:diguanylate cyclase (GGDEF)-like protein